MRPLKRQAAAFETIKREGDENSWKIYVCQQEYATKRKLTHHTQILLNYSVMTK